MPVIVSLLGATLCALGVVLAAETMGRGAVAGDTEGTERWLIGRISEIPGPRRAVAVADGDTGPWSIVLTTMSAAGRDREEQS